jgi:hypothetical protein
METTEDIMKTMEYKVMKKTLMRQYPFVKDVIPTDDHEKYKTLSFFNVILDKDKFEEYMGSPVSSILARMVTSFPYLSLFYDVPRDSIKAKDTQKDMEDLMIRVHKSNAIDPTMKMKRKPNISIFTFDKTNNLST